MNLRLRKSFSGLLLLVILLNVVQNYQDVVFAKEVKEVYDFGGGVTGILVGDTLVVEKTGDGSGRMGEFNSGKEPKTPIYSVKGIKNVEIGEEVRRISSASFYKSTDSRITGTVTIGDSVTRIDQFAFASNLIENVVIGDSVNFIGESAFQGNKIGSLIIPDSVRDINKRAFSDNEISTLRLGKNIRKIEERTFLSNKLTSVTIPESVKEIGVRMLFSNPLVEVNIPSNLNLDLHFSSNGDFKTDYDSQGKQGGVYRWNSEDGKWEIGLLESNGASLSGITVDEIKVEDFDEATKEYFLPETTNEKITISATAVDSKATISGDIGEKDLAVGENTFSIKVTSEDGIREEIYTINIARKESTPPAPIEPEVPIEEKYTVKFNLNGGSIVESIENLSSGSKVIAPDTPTKDGFTFEGWHKEERLINRWNFEDDVVSKNMTLYAKWIEIEVPKSNDSRLSDLTVNGITVTDFNESITSYTLAETKDKKINIEATTADKKAEITGDIGEKDLAVGENTFSIKVTAEDEIAKKIYIINIRRKRPTPPVTPIPPIPPSPIEPETPTEEKYTVKFDLNGGSMVNEIKDLELGSKVKAPELPIKDGFTFEGWYKEEALINEWNFEEDVVTSDIILYAKWKKTDEIKDDNGELEIPMIPVTPVPLPPTPVEPEIKDPVDNDNSSSSSSSGNYSSPKLNSKHKEKGKQQVDFILDAKQVEKMLIKQNKEDADNILEILMTTKDAHYTTTILDGNTIKKLAESDYNISIKTENIAYTIPAKDIEIERIAEILGTEFQSLEDIKVEIRISEVDEDKIKEIEKNAKKNNYEILSSPVEFEISAKIKLKTGEEKQLSISRFNNYVERVLKISKESDFKNIVTGAVYNECGTFAHIPTQIFEEKNEYSTKLNSLTNSIYLVIGNSIAVPSVENHWSKESVNDMVSRLVIENPETFTPDQEITRGEFAEYITKAIGIYRTDVAQESVFTDIKKTDKLSDAIAIAVEYGIIKGFSDQTFKSNEKITREQAMTMYARAMDIVNLKEKDRDRIEIYKDKEEVSIWAYESVNKVLNARVFNGINKDTIAPKESFTYAEAATAIKNLLIESNLINR